MVIRKSKVSNLGENLCQSSRRMKGREENQKQQLVDRTNKQTLQGFKSFV